MKPVLIRRKVAYFTMEIALDSSIPTYAGGLGVLAGDTIRSAADLKLPMAVVTLLYRKGYFRQKLDPSGQQTELPAEWKVDNHFKELPTQVWVTIEGRKVHLRVWEYKMVGVSGYEIPVYLLDTDFEKNSDWDRTLTHSLYGGDAYYRLCQEIILGIGGVKMLRALGHKEIEKFHMNEGHSSFLTLQLLEEQLSAARRSLVTDADIETVRQKCVFTTHTPVPAGHDKFPVELVQKALGRNKILNQKNFLSEGMLNMTHLALNLSGYINAVSKKHGEVTRKMFSSYAIDSITNGVHAATWASKPFQDLFDKNIPDWRRENESLRHALDIPKVELWTAHMDSKHELINYVNERTENKFRESFFTMGFARRTAAYKRADLIFTDLERLKKINSSVGRFQLVFAGKAHPHDEVGKELIHKIFQAKEALKDQFSIIYLENYDMELAKLITSGVDLWLNNPEAPLEASGTSGMKAAINGIPSLSILDGWWVEGNIEGITGWSIGEEHADKEKSDPSKDAQALYSKLEKDIIPIFYESRDRYIDVMRHAIALNGSYFNTQRMLSQYVVRAYFS